MKKCRLITDWIKQIKLSCWIPLQYFHFLGGNLCIIKSRSMWLLQYLNREFYHQNRNTGEEENNYYTEIWYFMSSQLHIEIFYGSMILSLFLVLVDTVNIWQEFCSSKCKFSLLFAHSLANEHEKQKGNLCSVQVI